jgi:hypothetical protein
MLQCAILGANPACKTENPRFSIDRSIERASERKRLQKSTAVSQPASQPASPWPRDSLAFVRCGGCGGELQYNTEAATPLAAAAAAAGLKRFFKTSSNFF